MSRRLHLRVVCAKEPPSSCNGRATEFGLQAGRSTLIAGERHSDGALAYTCDVELYRDTRERLRFRGDFVQGTPAEAFVYLSWRYKGSETEWAGRVKLMLGGIADLVDVDTDGEPIQIETEATGPSMGPTRQGVWRLV